MRVVTLLLVAACWSASLNFVSAQNQSPQPGVVPVPPPPGPSAPSATDAVMWQNELRLQTNPIQAPRVDDTFKQPDIGDGVRPSQNNFNLGSPDLTREFPKESVPSGGGGAGNPV